MQTRWSETGTLWIPEKVNDKHGDQVQHALRVAQGRQNPVLSLPLRPREQRVRRVELPTFLLRIAQAQTSSTCNPAYRYCCEHDFRSWLWPPRRQHVASLH